MTTTTRRRRIDTLTAAERATFAPYAQQWIERGLRTGPLTDAEWATVQDAVRRCYRYADLPEPKTVIRVPSPIVGAIAAPVAAFVIELHRRGAVDGAVGGAVDGAVDDAVDDAEIRKAVAAVLRNWYVGRATAGQHWSAWQAWRMWFRDEGGLDLDGDLWDRAQAYAEMSMAGYVWMYPDFAMVVDRPTQLHTEQIAPTGWGSHRLHCETGPAVAWADGTAVYAWHGTRVPADLIEGDGWDYGRIMTEPNSEIRRCAAERMTWPRFVAAAGLELVDECPDPANAPHTLRLYDLPEAIYDTPVRLLLMTNGSPDRSGELREYGETVPATCKTALAAAAWQYGWPVEAYQQLARRT